jgi:glycosyltransferase involved in cell wall biosynthesis
MEEIESCHVLDGSTVPGLAFTEALSRLVDTTAWLPQRTSFVARGIGTLDCEQRGGVRTIEFPLQRGYHHPLVDRLWRILPELTKRLVSQSKNPAQTLLICTSPYWAPVAEMWAGPVVYYSLDFTYAYDGFSPRRILELDRRLCRASIRVFPVSQRVADYLVNSAGCQADKIIVLPNATRRENLQASVQPAVDERPRELRDIEGPIAGVIGNMADNIDWILLRDAMGKTTGIHWVFIGPVSSKIRDGEQSAAREDAMRSKQALFIGERPYNDLQGYARGLDVAVLPYRRKEPTYSGSATRYYEHLAAGRPMLATPNVAELLEKEPFVRLVDSAEALAKELARLRENGFRDGLEEARLKASRGETWDVRARVMLNSLTEAGKQQTTESRTLATHR